MREDRFPPLNSVPRSLLRAAKRPPMGAAVPLCSQLQQEARWPAVLPPHGSSHTPFTSQDEGLPCQTPHIRRDWAKTNREGKNNGEASCSHRLPPLLFSSPSPACDPREGSTHIRLEPVMPRQIFQSSKWVKTQGKRPTIGEDLTAFHLKLELKTEMILIKLFLAVATGTHYLGLQPHLHTGEQQVRAGERSDGKPATEIKLLKEVSLVIGNLWCFHHISTKPMAHFDLRIVLTEAQAFKRGFKPIS